MTLWPLILITITIIIINSYLHNHQCLLSLKLKYQNPKIVNNVFTIKVILITLPSIGFIGRPRKRMLQHKAESLKLQLSNFFHNSYYVTLNIFNYLISYHSGLVESSLDSTDNQITFSRDYFIQSLWYPLPSTLQGYQTALIYPTPHSNIEQGSENSSRKRTL